MTSKAARRRFKKADRLRAFREARRGEAVTRRGEQFRSAMAALMLFVCGVLLTGYSGLMFAGATGLSGTAGRLYVDSCAVVRPYNDKPVIECRGQLLSTDGRLVDTDAVIQADAGVGATIPVRDQPLTGLETLGFRAVAGWATMTVMGLTALAFGCVTALTMCGLDGAATVGTRYSAALAGIAALGGLVYFLTVLYEHLF
jgi:hypothetical protein